MATQTGGFIRDQNLNVHFDVAPSGMKTSKPQKNGGLGGRKALGDISNSRRPSILQPSNKLSSKNVISVEEDFVPAITKSSFGGKIKVSSKAVGRKALGDLTNSVKPHVIQESKKAQDEKLSAVVEEPFPLNSEGIGEYFLHDHRKCIKAQEKAKALELDYFLKEYGISNSTRSSPPWVPPAIKTKPESPIRVPEMEEVPEPWYKDTSQWNKNEVSSEATLCASPVSPPRFHWDEYILPSLELKGTP